MEKKIALVTGANRGIGLEACRQLARLDMRVILTSRDPSKGWAAQADLARAGINVDFRQLDVRDQDSIQRLKADISHDYGRLDILVNNAGVLIDRGIDILNTKREALETTLAVNLTGPLQLCQAFIPMMQENGYGRVVNVSSGAGQLSDMGGSYPAYRISKAALNALTAILAHELKGTDILVNAMCPGWVRTDMGGQGAPRSLEQGADTITWLATLPPGGPQGGFFRDRKRIEW